MSIDHHKSISKAVSSKQSDIEAMARNSLSANTTTEVIAAHDLLITGLYDSIPTEQDAIDAVADVGV
jgi:hypothetical protein